MLQLFKKNFYIFIFREQAREEEIILLIGRAACNSFRGGGLNEKLRKLNVSKRVWICMNRRDSGGKNFLQGVEKGIQEIQLILVPTRGGD